MSAVIAIVGRPNVGKSTLFNRLLGSRKALVGDCPGLTRDRRYESLTYGEQHCLLIDTGGIGDNTHDSRILSEQMEEQTLSAVAEADLLLWVVDGREGLVATEEELAQQFRKADTPVHLVVNKLEGMVATTSLSEFYALGLPLYAVSARRGDGVRQMMTKIFDALATTTAVAALPDNQPGNPSDNPSAKQSAGPRIVLLGRPNTGKSTLVNRVLGEERMLTSTLPGTTRDSISISVRHAGKPYVLIDTAGVRRKGRIHHAVEKISVVQSFRALQMGDAVILMLDAQEGVTEQDLSLLGLVADSGLPLLIALNKWDGLSADHRRRVKAELSRRCSFVSYAQTHYISALHGSGIGGLFTSVDTIEKALAQLPATHVLTRILQHAISTTPPPYGRSRLRIKLRYAHLGGTRPVKIIIHGNQTRNLPPHYLRYLARVFREQLRLIATPVLVECRQGENPYKERRNILNRRQLRKRKRLLQHARH